MEQSDAPIPDREVVLDCLDKVCNSQELSGAQRLQDFLSYVVAETLEGRGGQIYGKTIAEDVYKRRPTSGSDSSNLVRVDAGRLRRALETYYNGAGAPDPVRLVIDPGQYAVRFVVPAQSTGHRRFLWGAAILFLILLATAPLVFVVFHHSKMPEALVDAAPKGLNSVQREVLLNQSPATLEAVDLATQARSLIFPASNPARLIATRGMFERSVELSPNYFGGHAGLAQVLGLQSFLAPPGPDRDALIERGIQHAQTALNLSPASPWTQSALGWVEFVRGNVDTARSLSEQAVQIDPDDLDILNFDSLIGIFSGDFQHVVASANPANFEGRSLRRHAFTISYAIARYHLGEDAAAIAAFNKATALGAPISPISFAYLIAAHQRLGEQQVARNLLQDFETSWPNSRMEPVMRRLFTRPGDADTLFDALHDAGWQTTVNQTGSVERP